MRQWLDRCPQQHQSHCIGPDLIDLPGFEVIDCNTRRLVHGAKGAEFAALSYVWGSPPAQGVLPNRTILPNPFPEHVIEDALACALKLKIPYLWVDRYCIDQNDTNGTTQHLIQNMDKIYSAAKVTIISVAGDDASNGLPGVSKTLRVPSPQPGRVFIYGQNFIPVLNPKNNINTSKWATRGWTLQEGLLARRRLVFTHSQVYFQCTQSHCIESVSKVFKSYRGLERFSEQPRIDRWPELATQFFPSSVVGSHSSGYSIADVCNEFAKRDLTTDEDALRACLGIFSRFWASEKPVYQYCGLPFQANSDTAFAVSLLWRFYRSSDLPDHPTPARRKWGPSWSWLAWRWLDSHRISWDDHSSKLELCVNIKVPVQRHKQEIMLTINDYIEDIDGGGLYQHWLPYLTLSGWITTVRFEPNDDKVDEHFDGAVKCYHERYYHGRDTDDIGSGEILPAMWAKVSGNNQVFDSSLLLSVIFVAYQQYESSSWLIIHRVGEQANKYVRLGTCRMWDSSKIEEVQGTHYVRVGEGRMKLECRFDTIYLV